MSKDECINTYGGLSWIALLPAIAILTQTIVGAGIAIYQAISNKDGSVSFGGSKTIIQKKSATSGLDKNNGTTHNSFIQTFSAY